MGVSLSLSIYIYIYRERERIVEYSRPSCLHIPRFPLPEPSRRRTRRPAARAQSRPQFNNITLLILLSISIATTTIHNTNNSTLVFISLRSATHITRTYERSSCSIFSSSHCDLLNNNKR